MITRPPTSQNGKNKTKQNPGTDNWEHFITMYVYLFIANKWSFELMNTCISLSVEKTTDCGRFSNMRQKKPD
jgi:hypothetical protein